MGSSIEDEIITEKKTDTDFSKVSELLLNARYKRRKTILLNRQIAKITTIDVIAQLYDIEFLKNWVSNFAEWRTSGDSGKGRQDIVDIAKFKHSEAERHRDDIINMMSRR